MQPILEVTALSKDFTLHSLGGKRLRALDAVSFQLNEGEILGLTGKSGSGKSSLMKCIYRTYLPSAGAIRMRLADNSTVDLAAAAEHQILAIRGREMTYCSQFLHAIPRVPALEVAADGLLKRKVARDRALADARVCFERLGLPVELWDAYPSTFSGGEQQRVNIARAILSRPRFLLLDEPTASLDLKTKDAVIDMLLELKAARASMLLITHDAHTLSRLAGRRLHLEGGRIQ